jgi:peptide subunit release factor 1 (eRF1)
MSGPFLDALPQQVRARIAGEFACDTDATVADVAERAEIAQREVEAREEMQTLSRLNELRTTRAVVGLDATIDMLNQQRVMTLVIDGDYRVAGGVDDATGMLTTQTDGTYEATGGPIRRESDLVEAMLESAMAQGADLELVRSESARAAMAEHGPAAALLRF